MKRINFKKTQLATMGSAIGMGLFNPMSVEVLDEYFKWFYTGVFILCGAWFIGRGLFTALRPETIKLPKKNAKTLKLGKLIET